MPVPTVADVNALFAQAFPEPLVTALIADAALMLEGDCAAGYSEDKQRTLVKYLAAHLLASTQVGAGLASRSIDGVAYSYRTPPLGEGLKGTPYGQLALSFDNEGCLANRGKMNVKLVLL